MYCHNCGDPLDADDADTVSIAGGSVVCEDCRDDLPDGLRH